MIKYSGSNTITKMFQLFKSKLDSLAAVATTGSYNDLLDKPNIGITSRASVSITEDNTSVIAIPITIADINQLTVYQNGLILTPDINYTATTLEIELVNHTANAGDIFTFVGTTEAGIALNASADQVLFSDKTDNNCYGDCNTVQDALVRAADFQSDVKSISINGEYIDPDDNSNVNIDLSNYTTNIELYNIIKSIPRDNLVINGGMQVWQRGESLTGVGTNTYTADRMIMHETAAGKFTVEKYNDPEMGLCAKITCTTAGWINLGTVLELTGIFPSMTGSFYAKCSRDFSNHIVISPKTYDDATKSQTIILSTNWKRYSFTVSDITTSGLLYFTCLRGSGVQVGDVFYLTKLKIEEGSEATQYVSRTYVEELNMCQRYAVIYRVKNGNTLLFPGYGMSETSFRFMAQLPAPMRTKPTVTGTSLTAGATAPGGTAHNLSGVTVLADAGNTLMVQGTTSGMTAGGLYFLRIPNGGYMLLDAEIY